MGLMQSWVSSANSPDTQFPLNNLPYGVFSKWGGDRHCGVAIGDHILDLTRAEAGGLISVAPRRYFMSGDWTDFMAAGGASWARLREVLTDALAAGSKIEKALQRYLEPQDDVQMHMPFKVAEFTDFYAGKHHATNVGTMFRGAENALPPNWLHIPIGYNGRASTVVVSGTDIIRPNGQTKAPDATVPSFGPCKKLDIELEIGAIVGTPSTLGQPVSVDEADEMIFGYVLLNDWSARDIQAWEYQPLGPFQAKAFATSISPWIVTAAALQPFRTHTPARDTELLPYLNTDKPMLYDIDLSITMQPHGRTPSTIARTNYRQLYYSAAQQLTHHASSGCAMSVGDLLGSGTISGPNKSERGSLLELSWGGAEPLTLDTGETRTFIEDGDTLTLHGAAMGDGFQIGFGACTGTIKPAPEFPT